MNMMEEGSSQKSDATAELSLHSLALVNVGEEVCLE